MDGIGKTVDYIIVGQGISGTWLSYWLIHFGAKVLVIDLPTHTAATRAASGVINPVTGRQVVTTWMAEELLPFAEVEYQKFGFIISEDLISLKPILAFPASEQMLNAYQFRMDESATQAARFGAVGNKTMPFTKNALSPAMANERSYIKPVTHPEALTVFFNYHFGVVQITPAYLVQLHTLLNGWGKALIESNSLVTEIFDNDRLTVNDEFVTYRAEQGKIHARAILFADGKAAAASKYWQGLPFSINKGEAIIAEIEGLPHSNLYKFGITTLVPWYNGQWWIGSTYENDYENAQPTPVYRQRMEVFLQHTLKGSFKITDHFAALRPANLERRPFAGLHPHHPQIGIFNGMGSKGVSLAPWYGRQLALHLTAGAEIDPAANVQRFLRAFF